MRMLLVLVTSVPRTWTLSSPFALFKIPDFKSVLLLKRWCTTAFSPSQGTITSVLESNAHWKHSDLSCRRMIFFAIIWPALQMWSKSHYGCWHFPFKFHIHKQTFHYTVSMEYIVKGDFMWSDVAHSCWRVKQADDGNVCLLFWGNTILELHRLPSD